MLKYAVSQSSNEDFILTILEEGEYKGAVVKIVDLKFAEDGSVDFEMELPANKAELFKDTKFQDEITLIVGEIVKKSVEHIWKTQDDLIKLEETVENIAKKHNVMRDGEKLLIETIMEKGYLVKMEENECVAIDIKTNDIYHLEKDDEFEKLRQLVFPNIILN